MRNKKSSSSKAAKVAKLWENVFDIERHLNQITQEIAKNILENRVLHPESSLALKLITVMNEWSDAVDEAVTEEESK